MLAARGSLPGKGALAALREDAFRKFDASGLPHRRVEEWKYTDLRALMRNLYPLAAGAGRGGTRTGKERRQAAGRRRLPPPGLC